MEPGTTSRAERLKAQGAELYMPDPGPAAYLVGWLMDAGPLIGGGMGPIALDWAALQAWAAGSATPARPWELRTLRALSLAYVSQLVAAEQPDCPSPTTETPMTADRRASVAAGLRAWAMVNAAKPPKARTLGA